MRYSFSTLALIVFCTTQLPTLSQAQPDRGTPETRVERMFKRFDANADGLLSAEELKKLPQLEGRGKAFAAADVNADGGVSKEELLAVMKNNSRGQRPAQTGEGTVASDSFTLTQDVPYVVGGHELQKLDVYTSKTTTPEQRLPVMVFIHGGGWTTGDKKNAGVKPAHFTANGFVYVTINYRLSPDYIHPYLVNDCALALSWVAENIGQYGGDAERIYVMGHSAGAHLAALVSTDARPLEAAGKSLSLIKGAIVLDGAGYEIPRQVAEGGPILKKTYVEAFSEDPAVQADASPLLHVAVGKGIPPFLIIHVATRKDSTAQAQAFGETLLASGVTASVKAAENKTHMTLNQEFGQTGDVPTQWVDEFLAGLGAAPVSAAAAAPLPLSPAMSNPLPEIAPGSAN